MMNKKIVYFSFVSILLLVLFLFLGLGAKSPSLPQGARILALGDSLTAGYGAAQGQDFPTLLAQKENWTVINAGVSGNTSAQALLRLNDLIENHQPDMVLIGIGGNDFLQRISEGQTRKNIIEMIQMIRRYRQDVPIVLIAIPALSTRAAMGFPKDHSLYYEIANTEEVLLLPDLWSEILATERLKSDQVHPNAQGYALFAEKLHDFLLKEGLVPQ